MRRLAPPLSDYSAREWAEAIVGFFVGPLLFLAPFALLGFLVGALVYFGRTLR
jgi:hypothetical protein